MALFHSQMRRHMIKVQKSHVLASIISQRPLSSSWQLPLHLYLRDDLLLCDTTCFKINGKNVTIWLKPIRELLIPWNSTRLSIILPTFLSWTLPTYFKGWSIVHWKLLSFITNCLFSLQKCRPWSISSQSDMGLKF